MIRILAPLFFTIFVLTTSILAGGTPYTITPDSVYRHVSVLAHDSLEGREVGEPGEWKAAQYIRAVFQSAGLEPAGDNGSYFQQFDFIKSIDPGPANSLVVNGVELKPGEEFMPLQFSASVKFDFDDIVYVGYGITVPEDEGDYDDYRGKDVAGKAVIIMRSSPKDADENIDFDKYISLTDKIATALNNDATGVFFVTPEDMEDTVKPRIAAYVHPREIPAVLLRKAGLERLSVDPDNITSISGETELIQVRDTGYNVIGYVPARSDTTVIIGAHYDHLGWGGIGSLHRGETVEIHNGADDNGSGVAALLELSRYLGALKDQLHYSLLFIAFSGEENGVLGSGHFAKNMTIDSSKARMMINLDMIGRLKEQDKGLAIMGTGTCTEFKEYFDGLEYDDIRLSLTESGVGPSDHTPFYNRKIPALTFFTGPHSDYHKPSDDIEKIYPEGIVRVTDIVRDLVFHFDSISTPLTYQKTKDTGAGKRRAQFSVSLGVMPDHAAGVKGLRVDGVIPDRPGARAGVLEGDIVIRMGTTEISDVYDYMSALGKFRSGDTAEVVVERGADTLTLQVVF
ncbi:MAG: M28 family peptidase [Candidatus Zixiibacteriota bacterium]|nr:MAG: M28 family peptidase [candidate division Zixibacteria bacterium]